MKSSLTKPSSPAVPHPATQLDGKRTGTATRTSAKKAVGRPTLYTQALAAGIAEQLANGRSLAQILSQPRMPSKQTVYSWLHTNREFLDHYVRGREEQADFFADQCIEIADATVGMDSAGVAAARVRIEARKWRASVMKPKVYGTKVVAEQTLRLSQASDEKSVALDDEDFAQLRERLKRFVFPAEDRSTPCATFGTSSVRVSRAAITALAAPATCHTAANG